MIALKFSLTEKVIGGESQVIVPYLYHQPGCQLIYCLVEAPEMFLRKKGEIKYQTYFS